jgi:hypothetical protein
MVSPTPFNNTFWVAPIASTGKRNRYRLPSSSIAYQRWLDAAHVVSALRDNSRLSANQRLCKIEQSVQT